MNLAAIDPNGIKRNQKMYSKIHYWLKRTYGKANKCELCLKTDGYFQWALRHGHSYDFCKENFLQLCVPCHKKYDMTPETLNNMRRVQLGKIRPSNWKPIIMIDPKTGEELLGFVGLRYAAKALGISHTAISLNLKGITKTAGKYKWQYASKTITP